MNKEYENAMIDECASESAGYKTYENSRKIKSALKAENSDQYLFFTHYVGLLDVIEVLNPILHERPVDAVVFKYVGSNEPRYLENTVVYGDNCYDESEYTSIGIVFGGEDPTYYIRSIPEFNEVAKKSNYSSIKFDIDFPMKVKVNMEVNMGIEGDDIEILGKLHAESDDTYTSILIRGVHKARTSAEYKAINDMIRNKKPTNT
jgi:hypothetical protein